MHEDGVSSGRGRRTRVWGCVVGTRTEDTGVMLRHPAARSCSGVKRDLPEGRSCVRFLRVIQTGAHAP